MVCWLTLGVAAVVLYYIVRYIRELFKVSGLEKKAVFVSGCDSGFGRLLALRCARNGVPVYAGCLTKAGEESLQQEKEYNSGLIRPVSLDVTKAESVKAAAAFVEKDLKNGEVLWALVNNAGVFSIFGPDDWLEPEDYLTAFEVNCLGGIRCVHALRHLLKKSKGRIISTASVCGRVTAPLSGPYSVAKYGVESYMDAIRQEFYPFGVKGIIIEPEAFRTPLLDNEMHRNRVEKVWSRITQEQRDEYGEDYKEGFVTGWNKAMTELGNTNLELVVDAYWHGITAKYPRSRYAVGWSALFFYIPISFAPAWFQDWVFDKINQQFGDRDAIIPAAVRGKNKTN